MLPRRWRNGACWVQMLSLKYPELKEKLKEYKRELAKDVAEMDKTIQEK